MSKNKQNIPDIVILQALFHAIQQNTFDITDTHLTLYFLNKELVSGGLPRLDETEIPRIKEIIKNNDLVALVTMFKRKPTVGKNAFDPKNVNLTKKLADQIDIQNKNQSDNEYDKFQRDLAFVRYNFAMHKTA